MNNTPRKDCPDRVLACHDHCERYQAWGGQNTMLKWTFCGK